MALGADVGASLRFSRLDGALTGRLETVRDNRLNPTLDLATQVRFRLVGSIGVVLRGRGSLLLRRQTYLVGQQSVLVLPRFDFGVEVAVSVPLY